jgi:predicted phosphodiesterase
VFERFGWLHISDLHLRADVDTWAQNVVLRDLVRDLQQRRERLKPSFVIVSGDLAFSGQEREYRLVEAFFEDLLQTFELDRSRLFSVPGNHDVDRSLRQYCYKGVLHGLTSPQEVDEFLGDQSERELLLQRQSAYRSFEQRFIPGGHEKTPEGLAYLAQVEVSGLPISIVGLNSAWLCHGGDEDERKLLVGERQVINVLETLKCSSPRLVVGVMHHPPHWLRHFDEAALHKRMLASCDFLHRGHLHEPEAQVFSTLCGHRCVAVGAGAAHVSRAFANSYSYVEVDMVDSSSRIHTFVYSSDSGTFEAFEPQALPLNLRGSIPGTFQELATAIGSAVTEANGLRFYLAALILQRAAEVPLRSGDEIVFGSPGLILEDQTRNELGAVTKEFLCIGNLLRAVKDEVSLSDRVTLIEIKERIQRYACHLVSIADQSPAFKEDLSRREESMRKLAGATASDSFHHTRSLLRGLADDGDWVTLEQVARRHERSTAPDLAGEARRMLALALCNAEERGKRQESAAIAESLANSVDASAVDMTVAVRILMVLGSHDRAKVALLDALPRFGVAARELLEMGRKLAIETGDKDLRGKLEAFSAGGGEDRR